MTFVKLAAVAALSLSLAACSTISEQVELNNSYSAPAPVTTSKTPRKKPVIADMSRDANGGRMQCVPYVRDRSGIQIRGDAYTWWDQAAGKYARSVSPKENSVIVLGGYGARRGHVALVRHIVDARELRIDHANWLNDGAIYVNNPVKDVSPLNDWSQVKVWNIQTGSWGIKIYDVKGFIGPEVESTDRIASIEDLIN